MRAFAFPGSDVTVTTGLSRARHCAAANGSRAGAGLHGMGVALSAGVQWDCGNQSRETRRLLIWPTTIGRDLDKPVREVSFGARAILALYILHKSIQPTNQPSAGNQ